MNGHGPAFTSSGPLVWMEGGVALEVGSSLGKERMWTERGTEDQV